MKNFIYSAVALIALCFATASYGQFRNQPLQQYSDLSPSGIRDMILDPAAKAGWMLGVFGGMDYNMHYGGFTTTEGSIICCVANNGTGIGAAVGIKAIIPLSDAFMISPRISYEGRNGTFTANPEMYPILGQNNTVETVLLSKKFTATLNTIGADLFVGYYITENGLYVAAGPSVSSIVSQHFVQSEHIESPAGVTYLGGGTDRNVLDSNLNITKSLQSLFKVGAGYQLHLSDKFTLNPEAIYGIPFTKISKFYGWTASALQLTVGLLYIF